MATKQQDRVKDLFDQLKGRGEAFIDSDRFRAFLRAAARFHTYSLNNQFLIFAQYPEASAVNSYRRWQSLGRQVRKGERGIRILAPRPVKYEDEKGEEQQFVRFTTVAVFAYEQTEPIENFPGTVWEPLRYHVLTGDQGAEHVGRLVGWLQDEARIPVITEVDVDNAEGYYDHRRKLIAYDATRDPFMQLHVLLHEAAHALHFLRYQTEGEPIGSKAYREIVAEASAFIAAEAIGLDTSDHADEYIGSMMHMNPDVVDQALDPIRKISGDLIAALTEPMQHEAAA